MQLFKLKIIIIYSLFWGIKNRSLFIRLHTCCLVLTNSSSIKFSFTNRTLHPLHVLCPILLLILIFILFSILLLFILLLSLVILFAYLWSFLRLSFDKLIFIWIIVLLLVIFYIIFIIIYYYFIFLLNRILLDFLF